jgi:creatinine amidohydrolase/Fe(II)-dependent formamide hydrolase-like protein
MHVRSFFIQTGAKCPGWIIAVGLGLASLAAKPTLADPSPETVPLPSSAETMPAGTGNKPHGRMEEMLPDELQAVIEQAPVAFVPVGTFEHHGWHLPVCFDGIKAHALCERVAQRTGGTVLPTFFYGTGGGHIGYPWTLMLPEAQIMPLIEATLDHLARHGFRAVVLLTGHYPKEQVDMVHRLAREAQSRHPQVRFLGLTEPEITTPLPGDSYGGDHAAKYETSIALALNPKWVHLDRLTAGRDPARVTLKETPRGTASTHDPTHPLYAIYGQDPRTAASKELGEKLVAEIVSRLAGQVERALNDMGVSLTRAATFGEDVAFLQKHTPLIVLTDRVGKAKVAVSPAWQGRVMTSTADGDDGGSYGWINRELIASGTLQPHINVFGGEDRFWLGPEGGQYSIFFAKGAKFELSDWFTPASLDTMGYSVARQSKSAVTFQAAFSVTNYSGIRFDVNVKRSVKLLSAKNAADRLGVKLHSDLSVVAFESVNQILNTGPLTWRKNTGLLSVWILGMFNPSPSTTIVVPIKYGSEPDLGPKVTSDYFGNVPPDRLVVKDRVVFFSGDGQYRSKIGISPLRSRAVLGSYDAARQMLTIVQFTQPEGVTDYVNSLWKIQEHPYGGDAANSYNDGPPAPGAKPLGPFFELESSSPAAALSPGQSLKHVHRTMHWRGPRASLDTVARAVLGVSLAEIETALPKR